MTYFFIQGSGFRVQRGQCGAYKQGSVVNVYGAMPKGFLTAGFPRIAAFPNGEGCDMRYEDAAIPDTLPSPRGEGAPKGRIGH